MSTEYSASITAVAAAVVLLTGITAFELSRPSDIAPTSSR
jgi:hypothetical protein